jgi:hypothetical protein
LRRKIFQVCNGLLPDVLVFLVGLLPNRQIRQREYVAVAELSAVCGSSGLEPQGFGIGNHVFETKAEKTLKGEAIANTNSCGS